MRAAELCSNKKKFMIIAMTGGAGELARLFLKNGAQRTGVLLNDCNCPESFEEGVRFISHGNVGAYLEKQDPALVEFYEASAIEGIDVYLK